MSLVEVRGRPLLLLVEGEPDEAHFLTDAMAKEGIRLHERPPESFPQSLQELAAYDGIVISDVPAYQLSDRTMTLIHDYVEQLGGGFLMIGGLRSFGVGGYYRTPIEDILPVRMQPPDKEERYSTALCLVIDRSGSMQGQKIEICKSAAIATADMLSAKDHIGVVAFDSNAHWTVPMMRAGQKGDIQARIATLDAGGGTNIYPGMSAAYEALRGIQARVKHMIVLSDGRTQGGGYEQLAQQAHADEITISTVGVGSGADNQLMASIAQAGGGKHYATVDPASIPRIFTQDAATHLGKLVREEAFRPQQVESHPMLVGWDAAEAPELLGYVKTIRKATTQVPLVTDLGDPLLAHWRFGLGKVTAFTSDCKSRWAALWIAGWPGYSQFWGQVLREMARNPQGRNMDVHLERDARGARVVVDVFESAAAYKHAADVRADVYFVPQGALGSAMRTVRSMRLEQVGPGRYEGRFRPEDPGVYLVRARTGSDLVSAGLVYNVSSEAVSARVDDERLAALTRTTNGRVLAGETTTLEPLAAGHARYVDLTPWLLVLFLLLFLADIAIRRWENVLGVYDHTIGRLRTTPTA
ncbi:MAG: glutamine amidotransferase [Planctomycetota bacterium]|nr:glutamine amidotransferase [Planctomycetota bacterium]